MPDIVFLKQFSMLECRFFKYIRKPSNCSIIIKLPILDCKHYIRLSLHLEEKSDISHISVTVSGKIDVRGLPDPYVLMLL
jgi:hypothetical protein